MKSFAFQWNDEFYWNGTPVKDIDVVAPEKYCTGFETPTRFEGFPWLKGQLDLWRFDCNYGVPDVKLRSFLAEWLVSPQAFC